MITLSPPQAPRGHRLSFSLRTLLVIMALVAAVAALVRQGLEIRQMQAVLAAYDLATDRPILTADSFLIQVTPLVVSVDIAIYEVVIETLGPRPISVASALSRSQMNIGSTGQPPALVRSQVLVTVDLLKASKNQQTEQPMDVLRVLAQVGTPSCGAVGGPSTYHLPAGKLFNELFQLQIKPGVYPRGKAVPLFDVNGRAYTLMVQ